MPQPSEEFSSDEHISPSLLMLCSTPLLMMSCMVTVVAKPAADDDGEGSSFLLCMRHWCFCRCAFCLNP